MISDGDDSVIVGKADVVAEAGFVRKTTLILPSRWTKLRSSNRRRWLLKEKKQLSVSQLGNHVCKAFSLTLEASAKRHLHSNICC